ncbi:MAG: ribosome small subunit-dependent GTPase A [Bacillota bacterium]
MIDLYTYGYTETETPPAEMIPGRVTELRREQYTVVTEYGEVAARLRGKFYFDNQLREEFPCVGDFVLLEYNDSGVSRIVRLLPRRSKFSRADFSGHAEGYAKTILEQVVAANFDYVFILSSLNNDFKLSRITRYLTQARQSGAMPVVILTKADLAADIGRPIAEVLSAVPDVPVHAVSSVTGFGLDALSQYLRPGKTIVFLGMSGVGKSSLLNTLMERVVMEVKEIRDDDSRGRHTTTHRQLFLLPSGAMVIDTPGMRELGLFDADEGISTGFADVEALFARCRFSDCRHQTEPGCAVTAALISGTLSQERWNSYLAQQREVRFMNSKTAYLMNKRAWSKSIAKWSKELQKEEGE